MFRISRNLHQFYFIMQKCKIALPLILHPYYLRFRVAVSFIITQQNRLPHQVQAANSTGIRQTVRQL